MNKRIQATGMLILEGIGITLAATPIICLLTVMALVRLDGWSAIVVFIGFFALGYMGAEIADNAAAKRRNIRKRKRRRADRNEAGRAA